ARFASRWSGASPVSRPSPTVYAGQRFNHRESGGTADAAVLGSGARQGVGGRLSPHAPADLAPRGPRVAGGPHFLSDLVSHRSRRAVVPVKAAGSAEAHRGT